MTSKKKTRTTLVSVSFLENIDPSRLPAEWQTGQIATDGKDTKAKRAVGGGTVFAYKFGALTFVNVDASERKFELDALRDALGWGAGNGQSTTEEFVIEVQPNHAPQVHDKCIILDALDPARLAAIAQVIAQSAAMEFYENLTNKTKNELTVMIDALAEHGHITMSPTDVSKRIGYALGIRNEVVGMLHLLDRPDIMWNDEAMNLIYDDLRGTFDLQERFRAMEYKLDTIQQSLEVLLDTVKDSRNYRAELMIIALIGVEIMFSLMTRFHILGW